jgi:hypothetical protein
VKFANTNRQPLGLQNLNKMALEVEKHLDWKPSFKNEIWITDKKMDDNFKITLREGEDIEIEFTWDYDYDNRGTQTMRLPVQMLKDLISELDAS